MGDRHEDGRELDMRPGERPGTVVVAAPRTGRVGSFFRGLLVGVLALVGLAFLASQVVDIDLNPFDEQRTDRSQPPLLTSIRDLSTFDAAEGTFQVIVDLQDGRSRIPDFLLGERTLFVAVGTVDASVEFGGLGEGAVTTSGPEDRTVTVSLPRPRLQDSVLDLEASYVASEDRGLLDRVGDAFSDDDEREREVYRLAAQKLDEAAVETDLLDRAEDNTRAMLTSLLGSLGYTDVTVDFAADSTT